MRRKIDDVLEWASCIVVEVRGALEARGGVHGEAATHEARHSWAGSHGAGHAPLVVRAGAEEGGVANALRLAQVGTERPQTRVERAWSASVVGLTSRRSMFCSQARVWLGWSDSAEGMAGARVHLAPRKVGVVDEAGGAAGAAADCARPAARAGGWVAEQAPRAGAVGRSRRDGAVGVRRWAGATAGRAEAQDDGGGAALRRAAGGSGWDELHGEVVEGDGQDGSAASWCPWFRQTSHR